MLSLTTQTGPPALGVSIRHHPSRCWGGLRGQTLGPLASQPLGQEAVRP